MEHIGIVEHADQPHPESLTWRRLLDECQSSFEHLLAPPALDELSSPEERRIAEVSHWVDPRGRLTNRTGKTAGVAKKRWPSSGST